MQGGTFADCLDNRSYKLSHERHKNLSAWDTSQNIQYRFCLAGERSKTLNIHNMLQLVHTKSDNNSIEQMFLHDQLRQHSDLEPLHRSARCLVFFWIESFLKDVKRKSRISPTYSELSTLQGINKKKAAAIEKMLYVSARSLKSFLDRTTLRQRILFVIQKARHSRFNRKQLISAIYENYASNQKKKVQFIENADE